MPPLSPNQQPLPDKETASAIEAEAIRKLQELFAQVKDKRKLVSVLANDEVKRPPTWSRLSNAPYYRERFALEFKLVLDIMMKECESGTFEDREYRYAEFPELSTKSLYLKINQSKLYLLNEMDPEGEYKRFCEMITITKERTGIRLSYNRDIQSPQGLKLPAKVGNKKEFFLWKDKVDDFLEHSKIGDKLDLSKLSLTPEDIADLEASLSQLSDILYKISVDSIKLIRISPDQAQSLSQ